MSTHDYIAYILKAFTNAFQPLTDSLRSPQDFARLLSNFGWTLATADVESIIQAFSAISSALNALAKDGQDAQIPPVDTLAKDIQAAVTGIRDLAKNPPANLTVFWSTFPTELLDFLLYKYLEAHAPQLFGIFRFLGVISADSIKADTVAGRGAYEKYTVTWNRIPTSVAQPRSVMSEVYDWGTTAPGASFQFARFLSNLQRLLQAFHAAVGLYPIPDDLLDAYYDRAAPSRPVLQQLTATPFMVAAGGGSVVTTLKLALAAMPIPPTGSRIADPDGFAIFPVITGKVTDTIHLVRGVDITIEGDFTSKSIAAEIHPGGLTITLSTADTSISAGATLAATASAPWILIGTADSSHIEVGAVHAGLSAHGNIADPKQFEYKIGIGADKAKLVINFGEGDGFLQKFLGEKPQSVDLSSAIQWSSRTGFGFSGQGQLTATIPVHETIAGLITVDTVQIALGPGSDPNSASLQVSLTGSITLGPISASVDRVGLKATVASKHDGTGNLGDLDVGFGFKSPDGLGLAVDAGPITGGGYLSFDSGRYSGVLQLSVPSLAITAIGILDSRLPGGQPGYSFLLIITAKFPPIQLGFGFALTGLGGLAGIHRSIVVAALQNGVRSGSADQILFPQNPLQNAPRLISDLQSIFPPTEGHYVFGPMAELSWGEPTIIQAELGIILQLPDPIEIILLGKIRAVLPPPPDDPEIVINLDIVGILDLGARTLSIDASLRDSHLLNWTLSGDMALRMLFGNQPNFVLSVGGFNPHFQPPPAFPNLRRLMLALGTGQNPRLSLQSYLAITSNTFQIGARADFYAEFGDFKASGDLIFDALFIFSPFSFQTEISADLAVSGPLGFSACVHLDATLSGPAPYHAWGKLVIDCLGKHTFSLDAHFGEEERQQVAPGDPWAALEAEIQRPSNWSAILPVALQRVVTLAESETGDQGAQLIDPQGGLALREKVVPFDRTLEVFGEGKLPQPARFSVSGVTSGSLANEPLSPVLDLFAPAQYEELSDAEKLSRPSFEPMHAGVSLAANTIAFGASKGRDYQYQTQVLNTPDASAQSAAPYLLPSTWLKASALCGPAGQAPVRKSGLDKYAPAASQPPLARMDSERYVIADVATLQDMTQYVLQGPTAPKPIPVPDPPVKGAMLQALKQYFQAVPRDRSNYIVVPASEVQEAT